VNNFLLRSKLVSVAATVLVLVALGWLPSSVAFAQPLRIDRSEPIASTAHLGGLAPSAAGLPEELRQERRLSPGPIIGLICAIVASSVALGIAFGIRRRIDRIAGPDPEKAEND
jgi:hypothetical protein